MNEFFVKYFIGPPVFKGYSHREQGPWPTRDEAEIHQRDIAGYEGVSACYIAEREIPMTEVRKPFVEGSFFVWVRGTTKPEGQVWEELYYGVDQRLMKQKIVLSTHRMLAEHLTMTLDELAKVFPAPDFYQSAD